MTDSEPTEPTSPNVDEVHKGYDLEGGLLSRAREWTDLLPWLRLVRTLRVAGSPPLLFIVAVTLAIWLSVHINWFSDSHSLRIRPAQFLPVSGQGISAVGTSVTIQVGLLIPTRLFALRGDTTPWGTAIAAIGWALLIWIPAALLLIRQGALLTAKRPMMGVIDGSKYALRRTGYAWIVALVPLVCVVFVAFALCVLGWISKVGEFAAIPLATLAAIVSIVCGLLIFGANVAVPMAWSALMNEKDADPLDSLSRGYEYLYRRPLDLVLSGLMGLIVLSIATGIGIGITIAAQQVSASVLLLCGTDDEMIQYTQIVLSYFPLTLSITVFWSLVGGVYLLMRRAAGGQEVEDIWIVPPAPPESLPSLPT